jgi:hypothetical protein
MPTPQAPPRTPRRRLRELGPLAYLGALFVLALLVLSTSRALLALALFDRVRVEPRSGLLFLHGLRVDLVTA